MRSELTVRVVSALFVLCAALGAGGCGDDEIKRGCREGFVLDSTRGECVATRTTCMSASDAGTQLSLCASEHRACIDGDAGASCAGCVDGFVEDSGKCKKVRTCEDLDCEASQRSCKEGGAHAHAKCGECEEGLLDFDGKCGRLNCGGSGAPGSLTDECEEQHRACSETSDGALCTSCAVGFVEESDECIPALDCEALECAAAGRDCAAALPGEHARCTECLPGYRLLAGNCVHDKDTKCDGTSNAAANVEDDCLKRNRFCVAVAGGGAMCGQCLASFVEFGAARCVREGSCESLDCESENRGCEEQPTGHCAGCLRGHVTDAKTGECRETIKCKDVTCAAREECQEASDFADAECHGSCGSQAIWNGRRCEPCPACNTTGEVKRWPWPTSEGNCICETEPGYYYSIAGDVGPFLCDADEDGWVRESARIGIESKDPSIHDNARCELSEIDRIVLENQHGQERVERLKAPLALYETDRNDDDRILNAYWTALKLPAYGNGTELAAAVQLNRFTKYCGSRLADYNDNGAPDVGEWAAAPRGPLMRPEQTAFNQFSYFAELHTSAYEPPGSGTGPGAYRIRERSRLAPADAGDKATVPLSYGVGADEDWRTCRVLRDANHRSQDPAVGMDFSQYYEPPAGSTAPWSGMVHHSQFKCVVIEADPDPLAPQEKSIGELAAAKHAMSRCALKREGTDSQPAEAACEPIATSSARLGEALWASVAYRFHEGFPVDEDADGLIDCTVQDPFASQCPATSLTTQFVYEHGCINECVAGVLDCPGYAINPSAVSCSAGPFGEKTPTSCDAWELCDGRDNDADTFTDDIINETTKQRDESLLSRDLRVGVQVGCDVPGAFGICKPGRMQCVRTIDTPPTITAAPACVFVTRPNTVLETCDGADQDCDSRIDENFVDAVTQQPRDGLACTAPGLKGECAKGTYKCVATEQGKAAVCEPTPYTPKTESCNGLDDDCNGVADDVPAGTVPTQACPATFNQYFRDADGDGYGNAADAVCSCGGAPGGYRAKGSFDCCDSDSGAYPGEPNWKTSPTACGHWDWDCSANGGAATKLYTAVGSDSGCSYDWGKAGCNNGGSVGWQSAVRECGETGPYYGGCGFHATASCHRPTDSRQQQCK